MWGVIILASPVLTTSGWALISRSRRVEPLWPMPTRYTSLGGSLSTEASSDTLLRRGLVAKIVQYGPRLLLEVETLMEGEP